LEIEMEAVLGAIVLLAAILTLASSMVRKRRPVLPRTLAVTRTARRAMMIAVAVVSAAFILPALFPALRQGIFAFCAVCPVSPSATVGVASPGDFVHTALIAAWYYAATVLPVFALACLLSGVLLVRFKSFPIRGIWGSFGLAAALPVCSCGTVPLGKTMIETGGTGRRDGIIFIATAPLLSPIILFLAFTVLGPAYAVTRIVASAAGAVVAGYFVAPFVSTGSETSAHAPTCAHSPPGGPMPRPDADDSLRAGWNLLTGLVRYALYGIAVGALFTAALPPEYVASIIRPGPLAMAAAVLVGVPINMCAGEEILLSAPLVGMGFTMGHALAFALAGTGICMGSIPLLYAALGRKATLALVAVYLVVPFVLGLLTDLLPWSSGFGPAPF